MACRELCMIDGADVWLRFMLFSMSGWTKWGNLKVGLIFGQDGRDSRIIDPGFKVGKGEVLSHERIGELLNFYCREAA